MAHFLTVILPILKNRFEFNGLEATYHQNVWIMALSTITYDTKRVTLLPVNEEAPTHIIRLVLRATDETGTNDYVDGTDIYMKIDNAKTMQFVWEDLWAEGPPIFHGGTVPDALRWVRELAEPFYIQLKDPFLTPDQRIALNGHPEDYIEPTHEQRNEKSDTKLLTEGDFDGLF